jgi:iron(III) transport system substrate-binding protein
MSLAACGSGAADAGASSPGAAGKAPVQTMAQLAKAAAKEGSLTWYTTFADTDVTPMVAAFNKEYPNVKVNALRLSADKIPPRVFVEQQGGKYNADVVSGDSPQVAQLLQGGALQPYNAPDAGKLPAGLDLPDGYHTVVYVNTTVIAYNPTVLKQKGLTPPTSWQDLTKPEWKGQFSIDPSAVNWYDSLVAGMGHAAALKLLTALGNNSPKLIESHTQALTQVQSGEPVATATAYGYLASRLKAATPDSIGFVNVSPLPSSLNLIDVVKNAPHPNAAKLFVDWMVSQQGQQAIVDKTSHTSVREDVKNDATVWDETKWAPAWGHPNISAKKYNTYVKDMTTALKAP